MNFYKKIKDTDALNKAHRPVRWIWLRLPEALVGIFSIFIILFCIGTYSPQVGKFASNLIRENRYTAVLDGMLNPFRNRNVLLSSGLPIYDLRISKGQYNILENVAQRAIKKGWMSEDLHVWVNGKFFYSGREYDVKVRLRGDLSPHWKDPKKSYRIKFVRQKLTYNAMTTNERIYFEGKRQINLIIPHDRDYILAYFINQLMREQGLTVPRDRFIILRINGVLQGLYYEVEQMDKPMLAAKRRPETTIFGQSDRVMHFDKYTKLGIPTSKDARFDIGSMSRSVDEKNWLAMRAMQVLIDYSLDPISENFNRAREILDWEKYLRFRNITTLCNTNHVRFGSDNFKLYFDSSRGLLEPIPWDVHIVKLPNEPGTIDFWNSHGPDPLQIATLTNPKFRLERNRLMWQLVYDSGDSLMKKFDKIYRKMRPFFWQDVLTTPHEAYKLDQLRKTLKYNLERVHQVLNNSNVNMTFALEAHNLAKIQFITLNFGGVLVQSIHLSDTTYNWGGEFKLYEDTNKNGHLDTEDQLLKTKTAYSNKLDIPVNKIILPDVQYNNDYINNRYWEFYETLSGRMTMFLVGKLTPKFKDPLVWHSPVIIVDSKNAVTGKSIPSKIMIEGDEAPNNTLGITAYDISAPFNLDAPNVTRQQFLTKHPQFKPCKELPNAVKLKGKVTLTETVIVPKHVPLVLKPGVDITLKPRVSVLSYGGLYAVGTEKDSIKIHGDDSGISWGVLATVRPTLRDVEVSYLNIRDAGQAQINSILLTGGLAVHDGDLTLTHSRFYSMNGEDGMNLKNGRIYMAHTSFKNCYADNVDLDFCTGEVRDCKFQQSGINGDGLDISGTSILITDCMFENLSDKGISVGENSHPIIVNCLIRGNTIGISSKDLSHPRVANCTFINNKLAIEAKRKKPFFGGGSGEFVNCVFSGNEKILVEDYFSAGKIHLSSSVSDNYIKGDNITITPVLFTPNENLQEQTARMEQLKKVPIQFPKWLPEEVKQSDVRYPGIYRNTWD